MARKLSAADFEGDDTPDDTIPLHGLTKNQLASATGLTLAEIDTLSRNGLPGTRGKSKREGWRYDLAPVVKWLRQQSGESPIEEAKRANLQATAEKRKAEAEKLKGNLIELDRVETVLADAAANYQNELMQVADQCPQECREQVRTLHHAAINRLAHALDAL